MHAESEPKSAEILGGDAGPLSIDLLQLRLGEQLASWRWRRHIRRLADSVESGVNLEDACRENLSAAPAELRNLMKEALSLPEPAALLVASMRLRDKVQREWRELMSVIVYPLVLFAFAVAVAVAFSTVMSQMVSFDWIDEFGLAGADTLQTTIADQHHAVVGIGMVTGWIVLVLASVALIGPPWGIVAVVGGMAIIGKPIRWICLQEILGRYRMFIDQGAAPVDASRGVANSFRGSKQGVASRAIAERIQQGIPLGQAFGRSSLADGLCRPSLLLLDNRQSEMSQAIGETVDLLGNLSEQRCRGLSMILPFIILIVVGTLIWTSLSAYFVGLLPLLQMITSLM